MSETERIPYVEMARVDTYRYREEIQTYNRDQKLIEEQEISDELYRDKRLIDEAITLMDHKIH